MKTVFFDSTLRDGSHAVKQQILPEHIKNYCKCIDAAGMYTVIVGHGNGIGASSILMTRSAMDELEMVRIAREYLKKTKLGVFVTVGFGTIAEQIKPAMEIGAEVFCIAGHCTEANIMEKHIKYLERCGKEVYAVLMNVHLSEPESLLKQCQLAEEYGADGVILMDSAGAYTPEMTERTILHLYNHLHIKIGFHPHNNLSMAVANGYIAIKSGAAIIDGTIRGFGAGAGNCQIEALVALLEKMGTDTRMDLYAMLDASSDVIDHMFNYKNGIDDVSIISGYAGVVSTFKTQVEKVSKEQNLNPRDVFIELGKRMAISGQDDLILEVAQYLKRKMN